MKRTSLFLVLVMQILFVLDEFMVSTDGFVPGVYFMRIYRNGELLDTQKLIVK